MRIVSFQLVAAFMVLWGLAGCSGKQYYKPEQVLNEWPACKLPRFSAESITMDVPDDDGLKGWPECRLLTDPLIETAAEGAVTQARRLITPDGYSEIIVPQETSYFGMSGARHLFGGIDGNVTMVYADDVNRSKTLALKKTVATAAVQGDTLAVLFANNDMELFSVQSGQPFFHAQGTSVIATDHRIAKPFFLGPLVVFSTLDGKYVVVDTKEGVVLNSTIVSSEKYFDNIFYFNVIKDTMVAATQNSVLVLTDKERREALHLRDVVFDRNGIWAATKEGEVIHFDEKLIPKARRKFPFAHFLGMIVGDDKIYLLEKEGYLIVMDKAMKSPEIYQVELREDVVFVSNDAFYVGDRVVRVR